MLASIWAFSNRSKCWSRLVTFFILAINLSIIERTSVRLDIVCVTRETRRSALAVQNANFTSTAHVPPFLY